MQQSKQRIILVEDNPGDAFLACDHLADSPLGAPQVDVAESLAQALALLNQGSVDAIVLDLNLPDSQGIQTLRRVKAVAGGSPIIVVSGAVDADLRRQVLLEGAEDVFDKRDTNSRLFSRSILFVIERNRASAQQLRFQALLDVTAEATIVVNDQTELLFANAAALELLGCEHDVLAAVRAVLAKHHEALTLWLDCQGTSTLCEVRLTTLNWGGQAARVVSIRDMSLHQQAEQLKQRSADLEIQNRQMSEASRLKSEFLANMSHEIRSPMNAVIGLSYLLERTPLDAAQTGYLEKIQLASKALLSIINNVLDVSKIEAGELSLERAPFDLKALLDELAALMSVQAQAKGIAFSIEVQEGLPPTLQGDSARLHQILSNLLANAIKFTLKGFVCMRVRSVNSGAQALRIRFEVVDSGIGIETQALGHLFKPFSQADASTTRRFGGSGLGLSIVKQLVGLMGGQIMVTSTPGVGSEFAVEVELPPAGRAVEPVVAAKPLRQRLSGVRVLVVDDNDINREVAQRILEVEGATVWLANNGQEAVDYLLSLSAAIDIVLMDVQMPVMDGHDATRRIRNGLGLSQLPIIALTAGALSSERERALASGMNDFISKPFDPEALVGCLARHVCSVSMAAAAPVATSELPLSWPQIQGIDAEDVSQRLGGDQKLFVSLLRRLVSNGLGDPAGVHGAASVMARLHELQGSAATLGAHGIAQLAAQAQSAGRRGDSTRMLALSAKLANELRALSLEVNGLLEPRARMSVSSVPALKASAPQVERRPKTAVHSPWHLSELRRLLRLLRTSDLGALSVFKGLTPWLSDQLEASEWGSLQDHVDNLAFDTVAQQLESLLDFELQPEV